MYRLWVYLHVVGVAGFLAAHGVSMFAMFRIPREKEPRRVVDLIELSSSSVGAMWNFMGVLLLGGVVAAFLGHWWGKAWLLTSIAVLVATTIAMYALAKPWTRKIGLVSRAMASGSEAVSQDEFVALLRTRRPVAIAVTGFGGLLIILFLMVVQPSFGQTSAGATGGGPTVEADDATTFATTEVSVPAGSAFTLTFVNDDPGVPHDVAIQDGNGETLFDGNTITGPATVDYDVPALEPGDYSFHCTIHPQMTGTITAGGAA